MYIINKMSTKIVLQVQFWAFLTVTGFSFINDKHILSALCNSNFRFICNKAFNEDILHVRNDVFN